MSDGDRANVFECVLKREREREREGKWVFNVSRKL